MDPYKNIDLDACAAFLRDNAIGYKLTKAAYEGIREVRYTDLNRNMIDTSKPMYALANTCRYVHSIAGVESSCLAKDTFILDYTLSTNLLGKALYGEADCVELPFKVNWVVARLYTGQPRKVHIPDDLRKILEEGIVRDLDRFVDMTCIYTRNVTRSDAYRLVALFRSGAYVQCKLTRLVKGCLIYLDHLESGKKTYARADLQTLDYKVKDLLAAMSFRSNTAYVYAKHEEDPAYSLILYAMCQQYPSPLFGGVDHVKIPADGDVIYLVGSSPVKHYRNVVVSHQQVMASLITYADQFWLEEELESAMIIACSLRQNRYLEVVGLPAVVSQCDLVYPALSGNDAGGVREKTFLAKEAAVMLGRFHQMACLVMFKDLDTSFRNVPERNRTMRSFLGMGSCRLTEYMEDQMSSGMLHMSKGLIWLKYIQDDEQGFKSQISVGGQLDCFEVFKEEVVLGGGDPEMKFADGAYNVSLACIRDIDTNIPKKIITFTHRGTSSFNF
ncbi:unnamed protein product [Microthlaspi erraticum]|uniref:Capsid protein N-terminal domain-containing protein n=1 Tax=Microthlaspi erraticum TaxID=1685480 RepID=A0A6D2J1Z0_9BRAS|nr:unnamed protein product [Microthlaspi erraticum]